MGKAGRWLRSFFVTSRKGGRKARDRDKQADADSQSVSSAALPTPASTPSAREKRRWSFRRPATAVSSKVETGAFGQGPLAPTSSQCFSEAEVRVVVVQDQHAVAVPEAATTAYTVASLPPLPPPPESSGGADDEEAAAAIKIQSTFRSYLARKALCALRGMVRLQAMVRGQLVRRQAGMTLRCMQALVDAQRRARAERLRLLEDDGGHLATTATQRPPPSRRSPQHPRSRKPLEVAEKGSEENVKIVEVDDGGGEAHGAPRACSRRSVGGSCYSTPAKVELYQKVSPTPSALMDASARTLSGRFDDVSFASASEPSRHKAWRADHAPPFPNYMANTESSRAKARSQSAPRQRLAASECAAEASPYPSCGERPPSGSGSGGARRRASLDPLDLLGARAAAHWSSAGGMERCASRARARASASASLPGSECGSSAWHE